MLESNTLHHISTEIPSATLSKQNLSSIHHRTTVKIPSNTIKVKFIDYTAFDTLRKEAIHKEEEAHRIWKAKFDPWLAEEYRQMYKNIANNRGIILDNHAIALKRFEWQQPTDTLPPLHKRLPGQRRRRLLGSFPETENDKIGWRLLPEHAVDKYGSKAANIPPLPERYKFSNWPVESFY